MSPLRHRTFSSRSSKTALFVAPVAAIAIVGMLAGCSTSAATPAATTSTAAVDQTLFALLPASIQSSKKLSFGAEWDTPPMIGVDASDTNVPVGIAVDLAQAMAPILGVTATFQNMQFPSQIPGVQSGNVDALMGQVSITAEREKSVVDLTPFYRSTLSILIPAGNPKKLTALADACGLTLGSVPGSILTTVINSASDTACVAKGKDAIKVADYNGAQGAISALKAGTIDGWLDSTSNQILVAQSDSATFATVEVPVAEQAVADTGLLGIAVDKSNPGITNALVGALKAIIANGEYEAILQKYNLTSDGLTADEIVPNPTTGTAVGVKAAS
ncbi:transporter substrate-binding domain-containing protein [Subtercola frigoramans]|uniref:ABC-type amino acid transport substrate-binding protein n=1 Tax=Subtercola frigoramans TaxID=120298 RepID=A0ABS2L9A3_9MICO|nr:transporter substrate-binding domain-containing protein [Subtercola frigoramans]MBM7473026.1 ABC-type amino acid transport substrate-binding protein [Subtercola frigoramans]